MKHFVFILLLSGVLAACASPQISQRTEIFGVDDIQLNVVSLPDASRPTQLASAPVR